MGMEGRQPGIRLHRHHLRDVDAARLRDELRKLLPAQHRRKKAGRSPATAVTEDARAWSFEAMHKALAPLRRADKLGYVLFQLAPWVKFRNEELEYLARIPRALPRVVVAVEFRNRSWFGPHTTTMGNSGSRGSERPSLAP